MEVEVVVDVEVAKGEERPVWGEGHRVGHKALGAWREGKGKGRWARGRARGLASPTQ